MYDNNITTLQTNPYQHLIIIKFNAKSTSLLFTVALNNHQLLLQNDLMKLNYIVNNNLNIIGFAK